MAIKAKFKEKFFGIGDRVKIQLEIDEADKKRTQIFDGVVIRIKGSGKNKSFTVRRIGAQQIGIERIFPLNLPQLKDIQVIREGTSGVKRSKLYYLKEKPKKELERIYSRSQKRNKTKISKTSKVSSKNASKKQKKTK